MGRRCEFERILQDRVKNTIAQNGYRTKKRRIHKHPLKPWNDPDSLFCDTDFLRTLIGKEPAKGNECKE